MLGHIRNREQLMQTVDFGGLKYGTIRPTDIDAVIEFKDMAYVLVEIKRKSSGLPYGQRTCIERMANDLSANKKDVLAIVAEHSVKKCDAIIPLAECGVREIYMSREKIWRPPKRFFLVREICDLFLNRYRF